MPPADSMKRLAGTCEAVAATTKKTEKTALVRDYLLGAPDLETAAQAAIFLSARVFPAYEERTLNVGGSLLAKVVNELSGKGDQELSTAYRKYGDLGSAAHDVLLGRAPHESTLSVSKVALAFDDIAAARGTAAKAAAVRSLLSEATAIEAKYIIKITTGDLRIGLRESLVEEAIAKAYGDPLADVQRANMLLGDIAATLRLAADHRLSEARMRLFHPIGFMLASPADSAEEAFSYFEQAQVEDKYDGIRAQAHVSDGRVRLFSRTLDDITQSFPELIPSMATFTEDIILDGEILAWRDNHALPFSQLQQRLGRKRVSESLMRDVPVAYVAFDVLYAGNELVIERPLRDRATLLDSLFHSRSPIIKPFASEQGKLLFEPDGREPTGEIRVLRAPIQRADSATQLDMLFDAAQARGNEGLMIKDVESPYTPGGRGRSWLKMKRQLATLDVVVTSVEFGHGKRARVLSDYTFAVRDGDQLVNIGKAYNGLTDREIAEMTEWFMAHTTADHGYSREVEPKIVLEVAFNAIMKSARHASGYALRFPRILRIRSDKPMSEIDTVGAVEKIFSAQNPHLKKLAGD